MSAGLIASSWCAQPGDDGGAHRPAALQSAPAGDLFPDSVACGPNSVYLLLRLSGIKVTEEAVKQYWPSHPEGLSLTEVAHACRSLGLPVAVRACSLDDLLDRGVDRPVIAYTEGLFAFARHYVVITSGSPDRVLLIDPTTAEVHTIEPSRLERHWKGYIILPEDGGPVPGRAWAAAAGLWGTVAGVAGVWARRRRTMRTLLLTLLMSLSLPARSLAGAPSDLPPGDAALNWRASESDSVNALYVLCRAAGVPAQYDDLHARVRPGRLSLLELAAAARREGLPVVPSRLTFRELCAAPMPIPVHLEPEGVQSGGFFIVVFGNTDHVALMDCGSATWRIVPADRFQREWTGYALVARRGWHWPVTVGRVGSVMAGLGLLLMWKRTPGEGKPLGSSSGLQKGEIC